MAFPRQAYFGHRPLPIRPVGQGQAAAVFFDDLLDDGQAQARSPLLQRDIGFEQAGPVLGQADAVVGDADGHRIDGGEYDLTEVVSPTPDGTGAVLLSVVWDQAASSEIDERGEPVDSLDGGTQVSASVILQRTDDDSSWRGLRVLVLLFAHVTHPMTPKPNIR